MAVHQDQGCSSAPKSKVSGDSSHRTTYMASKVQERIYAEKAIELLGKNWQLTDIPEPPDFEVSNRVSVWGLEIRCIYKSEDVRKGSPIKEKESLDSRLLVKLAEQYYEAGGSPIQLKVLGASLLHENYALILSTLISRTPGKLWSHQRLTASDNVILYISELPPELPQYSRWQLVDHRVGFARKITGTEIQNAIDAKVKKLATYANKYQRTDLLLVADRTFNSGRLLPSEPIHFFNSGFSNIFLLSYPES